MADDLGYADVGWQTPNYSFVKTPALNKLALGGIRFDNHHVQPFCAWTERHTASLLLESIATGSYARTHAQIDCTKWLEGRCVVC